MANLAESLATDALKDSIFNSVKNVYSSIKSYKGNLKLLHDNIQILNAKKDDIVRKVEVGESTLEEVTNEASVWLQNVKALLEDEEVNDLLNDELIRAKDQCCFGLFLCNLYHRYGMSRLAKSKVDEIKEQLEHLPQEPVTVLKRNMDLDPIPNQHCKGLDSREMLEPKILELLKDDQVDAVGICGMGGIGKTTLAKGIKNKGAKDMFDAIFMVEISQVANIERIQDHIAESIDLSLDSKHSSELRAKKLYNALKQMKPRDNKNDQQTKILIIMDNIWTDLNLDDVGIPHERTPQFCCKLLFTSRERRVCKSMGVADKNIVDVSMLGEDESSSLFWEQVKNVDGNKVEKSLKERLLRCCGGLPLAIVTLAKSLNVQDVSIWQDMADELEKPISCQSDEIHDQRTYKVIEASYRFIGKNEKKMFFLLACLYPSGLGIPVEDLMRYGIGLNLFKSADSLTQVIKQANRWTNELISSSLLLEDNYGRYGRRKVKVHDVVRTYTILCAEKDDQKMMVEAIPQLQLDDESWKKYTAISLTNHNNYSRLTGMPFDLLETLILTRSCEPDDHVDLFKAMARLKVLQLWGLESSLPNTITTLTHLRTLHLEKCILGDGDMEKVSELVGLVVLSLRGSDVKVLPDGMKNLSHLQLLDLSECRCLTTIPVNVISNLKQLEGLYMLEICEGRWWNNSSEMEKDITASIAELRLLRHLNVLELQVKRIEQVTVSDMEFITSIQKFKFYANLEHSRNEGKVKFSNVNFDVEIVGYSLEWLRKYSCLKTLISKSNHLKISNISHDEGLLKNLVPNMDREGFQVLEELVVENSKGLMRIYDGHVTPHFSPFPNLRKLYIYDADNMKTGIGSPSIAATLVHLETLQIDDCNKMKQVISEETEEETQISSKIVITFPKLNFIQLSDLEELECIYGGSYKVEFPTLKKLELSDVPNMTRFVGPGNTDNGLLEKLEFPSLEELTLLYETPSWMNSFSSFQTLRVLNLESLNWKHAFSKDMVATIGLTQLHHLEQLNIGYCKNMEAVVEEIDDEAITSSSLFNLEFPRLTRIQLKSCAKMRWFFSTRHAHIILNMPSLQEVSIDRCNDMELFSNGTIKVPKLAKVEVIRSYERDEVYKMPDGGDLNKFIHDFCKFFHH